MNVFVSAMQCFHIVLAFPAQMWVHGQLWCGKQWEKLRK